MLVDGTFKDFQELYAFWKQFRSSFDTALIGWSKLEVSDHDGYFIFSGKVSIEDHSSGYSEYQDILWQALLEDKTSKTKPKTSSSKA